MAAIKLRDVLNTPAVIERKYDFDLRCNNEPVWDYKDLDGKLVLIHDQNEGGAGYETVKLQEIMQNEFANLPIISESLGENLDEVEIIRIKGKASAIRFALNFKFNG